MRIVLGENFSENQENILFSINYFPKMVPFSVGYETKLITRQTDDSNKRHWNISITKLILQSQDFVKKKNLRDVFISKLLVSDGSHKAITYQNVFILLPCNVITIFIKTN